MKLGKGVTVHIGGRKYTKEIPDDLAEKAGLKKEPLKKEKKGKE